MLAYRIEINTDDISKPRYVGMCEYDTRRTVTWERYALASNGFHERVLRSSRYPLIGLTRNLIFAGKVLFLERVSIYSFTSLAYSESGSEAKQYAHVLITAMHLARVCCYAVWFSMGRITGTSSPPRVYLSQRQLARFVSESTKGTRGMSSWIIKDG